MSKESKKIMNEFHNFASPKPSFQPSSEVSRSILEKTYQNLHPNAWLIFSKLSLFHLVTAFITLALCPQFGIRLLGDGHGLAAYFMYFGSYGCEAFCGAFFIGTTFLLVGLLFKPEETRTIQASWPLHMGSLIMLSLGTFLMISPQILIGFALAWILGGMIGGVTLLNVGWIGKKLLYRFS